MRFSGVLLKSCRSEDQAEKERTSERVADFIKTTLRIAPPIVCKLFSLVWMFDVRPENIESRLKRMFSQHYESGLYGPRSAWSAFVWLYIPVVPPPGWIESPPTHLPENAHPDSFWKSRPTIQNTRLPHATCRSGQAIDWP